MVNSFFYNYSGLKLQSPFPKYTPNFRKHLLEVKVKISKEKARFFKSKKFFPSQTEKTNDDGSLKIKGQKLRVSRHLKLLLKS
jgi:hypothetical protein